MHFLQSDICLSGIFTIVFNQMVCVLQDEDEWKEFEQKEVDYSGLRVQAMQIRYGLVTKMFRQP